jgi:septal ring factor EnvC (AmiA/AmiB activator)
LTSSNKASRKVRTRTWLSIFLAISTFVFLGYLFVEVSRQSAEFGEIKVNYEKYVAKLQDAENQFEVEQLELAKLQATVADVRTELGSLTADRANVTMLRDQEQQKLIKVKKDLSAIIQQIESEEDNLRQLRSDQKSYDDVNVKLAAANAELSKTKSEIGGRKQELDKLRKSVTSEQAAVDELERQIRNRNSDYAEAKAILDKARADFAVQLQSTIEIQDAAAQAEARRDLATQSLDEVRTALNQEQPLLENERRALEEVRISLEAARKELTAKRGEVSAQESRFAELNSSATQAEARRDLATQSLDEVRTALNQEQPLLENERRALAQVQRQLIEQQAEAAGSLKLYQELLSEIKIKERLFQDLDTAINAATQSGEGN